MQRDPYAPPGATEALAAGGSATSSSLPILGSIALACFGADEAFIWLYGAARRARGGVRLFLRFLYDLVDAGAFAALWATMRFNHRGQQHWARRASSAQG